MNISTHKFAQAHDPTPKPAVALALLVALIVAIITNQAQALGPSNNQLLTDRYTQQITKIETELDAAKAHRTALMDQMDSIATNMKNVEVATEKKNVKNPALQIHLNQLGYHLAEIELSLTNKVDELVRQQTALDNMPLPTLIADALADADALEQHRTLAFGQYQLYRTRQAISDIENKKHQLVAEITNASSQKETISSSIKELTIQHDSLTSNRHSLENQFSDLSASIVKQQDRLERLIKRRQLIVEDPEDSINFNNFYGNLPDPTNGTLYKRFSEPKAEGLLKWEGILVKAPLGQDIEAVFDGEVVFAGQIQGLGNVAIIDHGMDFMSLYGMAELLVVEENQSVVAGQVIGTVGESVGFNASALYFEIRHNAETVDPEDWLAMQLITLIP